MNELPFMVKGSDTICVTNNLKLGAHLLKNGAQHMGTEVRENDYFQNQDCLSAFHTYSHPNIGKLISSYKYEPFIINYRYLKGISERAIAEYKAGGKV